MNWQSIVVQRAPGVVSGLGLKDCSAGLNVVLGRNGIGKSTLSKSARALLWQTEEFPRCHATAVLRFEDREWELEREGARAIHWFKSPESKLLVPDERFRSCFHLSLDELVRMGSTDSSITAEVRKEMDGGYELSQVCKDLREVTTRRALGARKVLDDARTAVRKASQAARVVLREEERLPALDAEAELKARDAGDESALVALIAAAESEQELAFQVAEAEQRDPLLKCFDSEHQLERLQELDSNLNAATSAEKAAEQARNAATTALNALGLPESGVELEGLALGDAYATSLKQALADLQEKRLELSGLEGELSGTSAPEVAVGWSDDELAQKAELIDKQRTLSLESEARRRALEGVPQPTDHASPEKAVRVLLDWLAASAEAGPVARSDRGLLLLVALLILAGMVAALAGLGWPALLWSAPLALVLLAALRNRGGEATSPDAARAKARRVYEQLQHAAPNSWDIEGVQSRLEALVEEWAGAQQELLLREFRKGQTRDLEHCEERLEALGSEIRELRKRLGVGDARGLDLPLLLEAAKVERTRRGLQTQLVQLQDEVQELSAKLDEQRAVVLQEPVEPGEGGVRASLRWESLQALAKQYPARKSALELAEGELERARTKALDAKGVLEAFLKEHELEHADLPSALRLTTDLQADLAARKKRSELESRIRVARDHWENQRPELCELSLEQLKERLSGVAGLAVEAKELKDEAAAIRADVKKLEQDQQLSEKEAALDQARDVLESVREEVLQAAAMRELMEEVRQRHRKEGRPAVLKRADRYFREFTHDKYQLEAVEGESLQVIRVGSHERLEPRSLSSGTRTQLLMALRLAFAEEVELGEKLPFFFDEALLTSDPERFSAIAQMLGAMVKEGRQVFYLTAEPREEVELRRALPEVDIKVHDLGDDAMALRQLAGDSLDLVPLPEVPAPQGEDFKSYAPKVGVGRVDGFQGADALHLLHLYSARLEVAYPVLAEHRELVGSVRSFLSSHPDFVWGAEERARFEALRLVAERTLELWRVGRAPRLTAEVIEGTKFSRTSKLDEVLELAARLAWDGAELVRALDEKAVKGLNESLRDELREELEELGYISAQASLEPKVLRERVLDELGSQEPLRALDAGEAAQLVHQLLHWLGDA